MRPVSLLPLFPLFAACAPSPEEAPPSPPAPAEICGADAEFATAVGDCAPEFTLPDRYDQPFTLSSLRGKVALVDIAAVW